MGFFDDFSPPLCLFLTYTDTHTFSTPNTESHFILCSVLCSLFLLLTCSCQHAPPSQIGSAVHLCQFHLFIHVFDFQALFLLSLPNLCLLLFVHFVSSCLAYPHEARKKKKTFSWRSSAMFDNPYNMLREADQKDIKMEYSYGANQNVFLSPSIEICQVVEAITEFLICILVH